MTNFEIERGARAIRFLARRHDGRRTAELALLAALAVAGSQIGCDSDHSPTRPAFPNSIPVVTRATYTLIVEPWSENRDYPRGGEMLVDDRVLWSGAMSAPDTYGGTYYYTDTVPANVRAYVTGPLAAGTHTLSFRVTDQRRSPTGYNISGRIDVTWNNRTVLRVASWEGVLVSFRTGDTWSQEFVVPATLPS